MSFELVVNKWSEAEWSKQTAHLQGMSIFQTWPYVDLHSEGRLRSASRAMLRQDGVAVVAAQLRVKRLPLVGGGLAEMEWAPICAADSNDNAYRAFLNGVRRHYCQELNMEVRVYPRSTYDASLDARRAELLVEQGFVLDPQIRSYRTYILDLSADSDTLRAKLHRNWRSHLKNAEQCGFTIHAGDSPELFDRFEAIYNEMWRVKRFPTGVNVPLMRPLQARLTSNHRFYLSIASAEGVDVGGTLCATAGESFHYYLGASAPTARQGGAPGYLLQWHNIHWARSQGFRWYDTGGFDVEAAPSIEEFKRRMGGTAVIFPGCFVAPAARGSGQMYRAAERLYRRARRVMTGR